MNVLITGATGFIGYHMARRMLSKGHSVVGTMRRMGMGSADSRRRLKKLEGFAAASTGKLQIARSEEFESLYALLSKTPVEACIHLAGKSWVRESINSPELYEEANYRYSAALLEVLRQTRCKRLVFASSVMVYGKDAPLPYSEEHLGGPPASPYGASKLACEALVNTYRTLHKMEAVSLRLFSVYGPEIRADCVPFLIASAILKNQPFNVFGDGSSMRDYVEIEDVLNAIELALNKRLNYPALNVGSGFGTTLLEVVGIIEKALGKKAQLVFKPAIDGELQAAIPDVTLTMEKLAWEPKVELQEGMERMVAWLTGPDAPPLR